MKKSHLTIAKKKYRSISIYVDNSFRQLTSKLRKLPGFLIVGAAKAGTTSLFAYLSEHPNILPSCPKEVHFF